MPIAFRSSTTAVGDNTTPVTINVPAGTANGDMLILGVEVSESVGVVTTCSGFTSKATLDGVSPGHDNDTTITLFWRRASSEPASYSVVPDGTYGNYCAISMLCYTGVIATGDPFRTSATLSLAANTSPQTSTALTGVQASDMAIHLCGICLDSWSGTDLNLAGPGGSWVERGEIMNNTSISSPGVLFLEQLGTGAAPAFTCTGSGLAWIFAAGALMAEPASAGGSKIYSTAVRRASTW